MNEATQIALANIGAYSAMVIASLGSAYGCGVAAASAIGGWKKCYVQGKPAPFQLSILTGAPMTQTIYGMILMLLISGKINAATAVAWPVLLAMGVIGGFAIALSAVYQGRAAAGACDALSETGQGFVNYLIAMGIIETIAIFAMVFTIMLLGAVIPAEAAAATAAL